MQQNLPLGVDRHQMDTDKRFDLDYPEAELVFGLVYAVGTDYQPVLDYLKDYIKLSGYTTTILRISDWFDECGELMGEDLQLSDGNEYERISSRIKAGNQIRKATGQTDIFALVAASKIFTMRSSDSDENPSARQRRANIIVSLKRPEEVESLRKIYGPGLFLIGIFADEQQRKKFLTCRKGLDDKQAAGLIKTDEKEKDDLNGQRTRDTFQMADLFVGLANKKDYETGLERFLKLVYGDPFSTPSKDEHAMFLAYAASLRSGDLSRQVGASLACAEGDVISLGCNDVPAPGGGLYCHDDQEGDQRDYKAGKDQNDAKKEQIIDDILLALEKVIDSNKTPLEGSTKEEILKNARPLLRETLVSDITEFGRSVHAEMDALMAAGRNGVSFRNATLYTTTFPCHTCTRHIIAAGVKRVVYIEPYPKSLATQLHEDAITISSERKTDDKRIPFEPFLGIGPRRFFDLFSLKLSSGYAVERKQNGVKVDWEYRNNAKPRVPMIPISYIEREQLIQQTLVSVYSANKEMKQNAPITGTTDQRKEVLGTPAADRTASRKVASMEDRKSDDSIASGNELA